MLDQINIWAVLVAGLAAFMLGGLWYSPLMFAKLWLQETGLKEEELGSPKKPMMITAGLVLVTAYTMAVIINMANLDMKQSMAMGSVIGIGIVAAITGPQFAFEGRSFKLYAIYAAQHIVELIIMGAIIGAWR